MWPRLLRLDRCIRAVEGTGYRATGLHRSFDVICAIYDTGTSIVDLTSRSSRLGGGREGKTREKVSLKNYSYMILIYRHIIEYLSSIYNYDLHLGHGISVIGELTYPVTSVN